MRRVLLLFSLLPCSTFAQPRESWIQKPKDRWPTIALVNEVMYKNGDSYQDPSLKQIGYAGTGFLINTGKDTLAVTAKHVLWIARNRKRNTVSVNAEIQKWIMHPRNDDRDVVVMDRLRNEDNSEVLQGVGSTILERDWLIFSIKKASKDIYPLKPRYTALKPGEKVYRISNPYQSKTTVVYESKVIRTEGRDILLETDTTMLKPGGSGSPIIDANGYVVGIMSSAFGDPKTRRDVEIAVSVLYVQDFLQGKTGLNEPKKSVYEKLYSIAQKDGVDTALDTFKIMNSRTENYFIYNLRTSEDALSHLGHTLVTAGKLKDAIKVFEFNVKWKPSLFAWNDLGKAYVLSGENAKAKEAYENSMDVYTNEEAINALEKLKSSH